MADQAIAAGQAVPRTPSRLTRICYGIGAIAFGVKNGGFDYFVLLFYGIVLGVDARLVGLAMLIALVFDAISDPVVGYVSDNWRSRWGRRHPFMYAAAIPVSLSYFMLWSPPDWSDFNLFLYLVTLSLLIRTLTTLYETPSAALAAELTQDYDARTTLLSYRLFFGWAGGTTLTVIMFGFLLVPNETYPDGRFNLDGYAAYGVIASLIMFASIMISALGTHQEIPYLKPPPAQRKLTPWQIFKEIFQTLAEPSFAALFLAALFWAVATGVAAALAFTILTFFWEFSEDQIFIWTMAVVISAGIGLWLAPYASRKLGKKRAVITLGIIAFTIAPLPIILRLFDLMPPNGDPILFPLVLTINTIDLGLIIAVQALFQSMIADLVEQSELKTGRRSEGVFFAAVTFTRKSVQGLGVLTAGFILALANFPEETLPGQVPEDAIFRLGAFYAPTILLLWSAVILAIFFYRIDRSQHEANLRELAQRRG